MGNKIRKSNRVSPERSTANLIDEHLGDSSFELVNTYNSNKSNTSDTAEYQQSRPEEEHTIEQHFRGVTESVGSSDEQPSNPNNSIKENPVLLAKNALHPRSIMARQVGAAFLHACQCQQAADLLEQEMQKDEGGHFDEKDDPKTKEEELEEMLNLVCPSGHDPLCTEFRSLMRDTAVCTCLLAVASRQLKEPCTACRRFFVLVVYHIRFCTANLDCPVPYCMSIRLKHAPQ